MQFYDKNFQKCHWIVMCAHVLIKNELKLLPPFAALWLYNNSIYFKSFKIGKYFKFFTLIPYTHSSMTKWVMMKRKGVQQHKNRPSILCRWNILMIISFTGNAIILFFSSSILISMIMQCIQTYDDINNDSSHEYILLLQRRLASPSLLLPYIIIIQFIPFMSLSLFLSFTICLAI